MSEENEFNIGWCLIPPYIMCRADLSANEKMLYGRILGLANKTGYCYASNEFLGEQLGLEPESINNILLKLKSKNLLKSDYNGVQRKLYPIHPEPLENEAKEDTTTSDSVVGTTPDSVIYSETEVSETYPSSKEDEQAQVNKKGMVKLGDSLKRIRQLKPLPSTRPKTDNRLGQGWQYYALEVAKEAGFVNGGRGLIFKKFKEKNWGHRQMTQAKDIIHNKNYPKQKSEHDRALYLVGAFTKSL